LLAAAAVAVVVQLMPQVVVEVLVDIDHRRLENHLVGAVLLRALLFQH
jgi:hypothetical protein